MKRSRGTGVVLITVGIGIGGFVGWWSGSSDEGEEMAIEVKIVEADTDSVEEMTDDPMAQSLDQKDEEVISAIEALNTLDRIVSGTAPLADQVPIYDLIGKVDTDELIDLLKAFMERPKSRFRTEVGNILLFRIASEKPNELADRFSSGGLSEFERGSLETVVDTMAWRSLGGALRFVESLPSNFPNLGRAYAILEAKARLAGDIDLANHLRGELQARFPEIANRQSANIELTVEQMREAITSRSWESDRGGFLQRFGTFAQNNPNAAMEMVLAMEDSEVVKLEGIKSALAALAVREPFKAFEYSYLLEGYGSRDIRHIMGGALTEALLKDKDGSLQWLRELPDNAKSEVLRAAVNRSQTSELLVPAILEMEEGLDRERLLTSAVSSWANQDRESAIKWAEANLPGKQVVDIKLNYLPQMLKDDPDASFALLSKLESFHQKRNAAHQLAHSWPVDEIPDLISRLNEGGDRVLRDQTLMSLSNRWAQTDLDGANTFAQSLPSGQLRQQFEQAIGISLTNDSSPEEAINYAIGMENANTAISVLSSALNSIASLDPQRAVDIVTSEKRFDDIQRATLMSYVAQSWGRSDPEAAARYFGRLGSREALQGMRSVAQNWGQINPSKALSWSMTIPNAESRDSVIMTLLSDRQVVESAPLEMEAALAAISDPNLRESALRAIERNLEAAR